MAKTIKAPVLYREMQFERAGVKEDARTIELSFSSEMEAKRWFGIEILDHKPGSVDLRRLKSGGALLLNHNSDEQIGVVESAEISPDRKGRAVVRFGKSARAEEIWNDVKDGIRRSVSVGYRIHKMVTEKVEAGVETMRATSWEPLEVSIVSVPVDPNVGIGRAEGDEFEIEVIPMNRSLKLDADAGGTGGGGGTATAVKPAAEVTAELRAQWEKDERARCAEIDAITERFPKDSVRALAKKAKSEGWKLEDFRKQVMESDAFRAVPITTPNAGDIGMNEKEVKRFSLLRACNLMSRNMALDGIEKEACEAAQKHMKRELSTGNSFVLPAEVGRYHDARMLMARAQNVGAAAAGGYTVETQFGPLIEMLRNKTVLGQVGIAIIDGLQGDFVLPTQLTGATGYWVSETGSITDSEATFGQKVMVPHRLGACVPFTKQFLAQTSLSAESFLLNEIQTVLDLKKDLAGLFGTGVSGEPLGVANTTGINATVTYGGAATWPDIVQHETGINVDNADIGSMAFIIDAATTGKWKTILKDSVAGAGYLLSDNMTANGYPVKRTQQVVSTSQSFFGVWSQLLLGIWAGREVTVDNITLAKSGQHQIIVQELCDFLVRQPLAFNVSTDSAAQ